MDNIRRVLSPKKVKRSRWRGGDHIADTIASWGISKIILLRLNAIESRLERLETDVGELIAEMGRLSSNRRRVKKLIPVQFHGR